MRVTIKEIEKSARDILIILQNIHNENNMEENISTFLVIIKITHIVSRKMLQSITFLVVSEYCFKSRQIFENVREQYAKLAGIVPKNQYYRYHDQWRFVTQRLCFLASLIIYLEVKHLVTKETVAELLGGKS